MQKQRLKLFTYIVIGIILGVFAVSKIPTATAAAGVNQQLNFQGRLLNAQGAVVPDGFYNVQFKIYQDGDGQSVGNTTGSPAGSLKWTETYLNNNGQGVQVKNGFMSVQLGAVNPWGSSIDWNQDTLWLSMNIAGTGPSCSTFAACTPDGEMVPMKRMSSSAYALNSARLGGLTAAGFIQNGTSPQTADFTITGAGKAATLEATAGLLSPSLDTAAAGTLSIGTTNATTLNLATNNAAHTINIGTGTAVQTISIGSENSTSKTSIYGGSNGIMMQSASTVIRTNSTILGTFNSSGLTLAAGLIAQNTSGYNILKADSTASTVTLGNITASAGQAVAGTLLFADGTTDNFGLTLNTNTLTASRIIHLPNEAGTICLQGAVSCGFLTGATSDYIQNQTAGAQATSNFWISGNGRADTALLAPNFDTATAVAANFGITTASSVVIGKSSITTTLASDTIRIGSVTAATTVQKGAQTASNTAGAATTYKGANGNGTGAGGSLTIAGGDGGASNANGGDVTVTGGTATGSGTKGLVNLGPTAFASVTNTTCSANCTLTQANVDNYGTIVISASTASIIVTLPAPTNTSVAGRTVYVTTASGSQDFTLRTNTGGDQINVAMRQNTTSTMIWNGSAWTPGGASNATTLQATYNNGSNPSTTPEIKLDSTRGTIDIQDADTTIGSDLLNIRGSNPSGLGTVLFGVSNTGRVTIQGTTDQSSAFSVLNSIGDYQININSANGYIINNSIQSTGNIINNPSFESGGAITGGEEGWFGPATASIQNNSSNAYTGNYHLQVTANSSNVDVFAGTYYEVIPGDELYLSGYVKNASGSNGVGGIQITWYDKDKVALSSSTAYPNLPGTSYVIRTVNGTAPANAAYARASATVRSSATSGTWYFDNFFMTRSTQASAYAFRNVVDSTTAFRIQSAGSSQTLFTADTSNNILKVGDSTGTNTATTIFVLDGATADPTTLANRDGGLFYRSDTGSLKAILGGSVVDVCTTAVTCTGYSASAGSAVQLQTGAGPGIQQTGFYNISGIGYATGFQTQGNGAGSTTSLTVKTGNATGGNSGSLTLDVGTATGTLGTIQIGHSGVATTMPGTLTIQGSNSLTLGASSSANGSIKLFNSSGTHTVTLVAPSSDPSSNYTLTLPSVLPGNGECIKSDTAGSLYFQGCGVGVNFDLQDAYDNSGTPADVTLTSGKNLTFTAADTSGTDPSVLVNLQCGSTCNSSSNGRFSIQNSGVDQFSVLANTQGVLVGNNGTSDTTLTIFQLDSFFGDTSGETTAKACSTSVNQGAMYYNTKMGSLRGCINGNWVDVSNPDTLGLLTFGVIPSTGNNPYDLPALVTSGYSGPCKASRATNNEIHVEPCTAYSGGRRVNVTGGSFYTQTPAQGSLNITMNTTTQRWGHLCIDSSGVLNWTSGTAGTAISNQPTFSAASPTLCIADVVGSATTAGLIDDIYDVRTFTSAMKEAVNVSTASELGMIVDAGTSGAMAPAVSGSAKLYGTVVVTNGSTSAGAPNVIVTTVGPAYVKATAGTAGQFIKTSTTNGYGDTTASIPNNSFYYSVGNTRTSWSTTCTTAANCTGSLYVNFIVR